MVNKKELAKEPEPMKEPEPVKEKTKEEKLAEILQEHEGMESNIPVNHDYWRLKQ